MRILVTYSSRTGNTKKVAEAIHEVMPVGTHIAPIESAPDPVNYDLILLGFWVDRGTVDELAQSYISKINSKRVALFATLGEYPDSAHARQSMDNARALVSPQNELLGTFICQGRIDPALTDRFRKEGRMTPERQKLHQDAALRPNQEDLADAKKVFGEILNHVLQTS